MKTLVIHPEDFTTDFLERIYDFIECTVVGNWMTTEDEIAELIPEYDRIICLGHGCHEGLLDGSGDLIVNGSHADLLRDKELICIWCNADQFMLVHNLKGFYSGMFISEVAEANVYAIPCTQGDITKSNKKFAALLGKYINESDRLAKIKKEYCDGTEVVNFNRKRLYDTNH